MSLKDKLSTPSPHPRSHCSVARVLAAMSKDDRGIVETAFANPEFTGAEIARVLRDEGHNVGEWALRRHRRGDCACVTQ